MKGDWIRYTDRELAWIKARRRWPRRKAHARFRDLFGRADVSLDNFKSLCTRKGWRTGRTGRFVPGSTPANKGKKITPHPNAIRTQFKKGQEPPNTKFAGHERVSKDGYVLVSINETNPHTGFKRRYVLKHKHLWERANGPVPEGHCLKCLDGNRQNTDPQNWIAIPRSMLPRLSGRWNVGYDDAPEELRPILLKIAEVEQAARDRQHKSDKADSQTYEAGS